ncbi:hypothetical protein M0811_09574 [Anaeramoeba ignava]|uniref:Uncharacterized protein n=1 Tax=Anaeramoeba ignava TaxID=1746090 RepID=A0A9Q0RAZ4_ANAIG|nr:hypothetical protein M0811_09574 [Anaeramoeba ignava]
MFRQQQVSKKWVVYELMLISFVGLTLSLFSEIPKTVDITIINMTLPFCSYENNPFQQQNCSNEKNHLYIVKNLLKSNSNNNDNSSSSELLIKRPLGIALNIFYDFLFVVSIIWRISIRGKPGKIVWDFGTQLEKSPLLNSTFDDDFDAYRELFN